MLKAVASVMDISRLDWDRLANPPGAAFNPLVSHDFFRCLEQAGCAEQFSVGREEIDALRIAAGVAA